MNKTRDIWDNHYKREKSLLQFPDENLVRILSKLPCSPGTALDLGCGSARHSLLLDSMGWEVSGLDYSEKSIERFKFLFPKSNSYLSSKPPYPIEPASQDLVLAWGVLHYNSDEEIELILREILRILKPGGYFIGTIRSSRDTLLSPNSQSEMELGDLKGGYVRLFTLEETEKLLEEFSQTRIGYMERTPLGDMDKKISHYFFQTRKP